MAWYYYLAKDHFTFVVAYRKAIEENISMIIFLGENKTAKWRVSISISISRY
jgi:hypothetical protein